VRSEASVYERGKGAAVYKKTTPFRSENHFQLDRGARRKACDAVHQAARLGFGAIASEMIDAS